MRALRIFRSACLRALTSPGLVVTLYLVNLLLAFPAFYLSFSVLHSALGNSLAGTSLVEGFDYTIWRDLARVHGISLATVLQSAVPLAVLGIAAQTFLSGGILDLLTRQKRFAASAFFQACGTYLGRFVRIWVLTAIMVATVALLFLTALGAVLAAADARPDSDRAAAVGIGVSLALLVLALLPVLMASDYARVDTVAEGRRSSWKAVGRGFAFLLHNPGSTLALHLLLLLLLAISGAVYLLLEGLTGIDSPLTIFLMAVLQQVFMIARAAIRIAFSAGEVALYEERKPRPVVFYGWDDSPTLRER